MAAFLAAGCGLQDSGTSTVPSTLTTRTIAKTMNIPFTLGAYLRVRGSAYSSGSGLRAKIITSRSELKAELPSAPEDPNNPQVANSIVKYTDDYFRDHAIVLILKTNSSGSIRDQYTALSRTGNQLNIEYTNWIPHTMSADMADWRVLLEVRKSDVLYVTTIDSQQQVKTLQSGVPIPNFSDYP